MTRLRAIVIGGGLVACALALVACATDSASTSLRTIEPSPAADDEAAASTRAGTTELAPPSPTQSAVATPRQLWGAVEAPTPDSWSGRSASRESSLAGAIVDLPPAAIGSIASVEVRQPVGLSIPSLGIDEAFVTDVGVEENGDFAVPPADEVGWYRFGPTPGNEGSAVLAAHIAQGGVNGVFRYLADLSVGAEISVTFDDGTRRDFRITEMNQYDKDELPTDELFRKRGESQLVLITCGGDFNRQIRSYDDNIVAVAIPI